jgi:hypothetical protein
MIRVKTASASGNRPCSMAITPWAKSASISGSPARHHISHNCASARAAAAGSDPRRTDSASRSVIE